MPASSRRTGDTFGGSTTATTAADEAPEDGEKQQTANGGADADDEGFMFVDPGFDLTADGGAFALAL